MFAEHPFIKTIAKRERWTVSDKDKRPIDIWQLKYFSEIVGATEPTEKCLCDLSVLDELIPQRTNSAYALSAYEDDFVVLDVEPKCPDDIKQKMLALPRLYGEISMSGKGYHFVFPKPKDILEKHPVAAKKRVLKEQHGWYEVLMHHYCTFTANMLPETDLEKQIRNGYAPTDDDFNDFREIFEELASQQKESVRTEFNLEKSLPDIPLAETISDVALRNVKHRYKKTPADFNDDMSRYEYATAGYIYRDIKNVINTKAIRGQSRGHKYSESDMTWLVYLTLEKYLAYRKKHNEIRSGLPWLLWLSGEVIAKSDPNRKKEG